MATAGEGGSSASPGGAGAGGADPSAAVTAPAEEPPVSAPTTGTTPSTAVDGGAGIAPGEPAPGGPAPMPEPAPEPEPVEVPVTDAEVVLVSVPSWDDTGTYLVPGYRFTADDGSEPMVPAVADDVLEPPPGDGEDPGAGAPGEPVPLPQPIDPAPTVTPETTTAPAGPDPAGAEVEIVLWHCGIEPVELDGQRWVAEPPPFDETNAPPELARRGTLAVAPGGGSATYTDASGVTVEMVPVGEDWQPRPCD